MAFYGIWMGSKWEFLCHLDISFSVVTLRLWLLQEIAMGSIHGHGLNTIVPRKSGYNPLKRWKQRNVVKKKNMVYGRYKELVNGDYNRFHGL